MRGLRIKRVGSYILGAVVALWLTPPAVGQEEGQAPDLKNTTRITLGSSSGTPGTDVVIPIYFTPAAGVSVGSLELDIAFVSISLKLNKLERGAVADLANVDLSMKQSQSKNEKGVETISATLRAFFLTPEPPKEGVPGGLLGSLTFRIAEDAKPARISLRLAAKAMDLKTEQNLPNVQAFGGTLEVDAPGTEPMVGCFFFSH